MIRYSVLLLALWCCAVVSALEGSLQELVGWETGANAVSKRSADPVPMEHYEIPLRLLKADRREVAGGLESALVFEKDGETYVRWILNPEDTQYRHEVKAFLERHGADTTLHQRFTGYRTASRTWVVETPEGQTLFVKGSTNRTGGQWQGKGLSYDHAEIDRIVSDYARRYEQTHGPFQYVVPIYDVAAFGIQEGSGSTAVDLGMIVRDTAPLQREGFHYVPGFSVLHDEVGLQLAQRNGSSDPAAFWEKHYAEPLGRALAEMRLKLGLDPTSPHSQNFLVELDANYRPTGRIALRDFGDTRYDPRVMEANGAADLATRLQDRLNLSASGAMVGFVHGNRPPAWLSREQLHGWERAFFAGYDQSIQQFSGVEAEAIRGRRIALTNGGSGYATRRYPAGTLGPAPATCWQHFRELVRRWF